MHNCQLLTSKSKYGTVSKYQHPTNNTKQLCPQVLNQRTVYKLINYVQICIKALCWLELTRSLANNNLRTQQYYCTMLSVTTMQYPHLHHHEKYKMSNYIITHTHTSGENLQNKLVLVMFYFYNASLLKSALKTAARVSYRHGPDPSTGRASSSSDLGRSFLLNPSAICYRLQTLLDFSLHIT